MNTWLKIGLCALTVIVCLVIVTAIQLYRFRKEEAEWDKYHGTESFIHQ